MAYRIDIDPGARQGVGVLFAGVTGDEFAEAVRALYQHPRWQPGFDVIWDLTAVRELVIDQRGVETIVATTQACRPLMGAGRAAFVVPHEMHHTIAALLLHRTRESGRDRRLFDRRTAADAWLDFPPLLEG
jgi:hypothetical protein